MEESEAAALHALIWRWIECYNAMAAGPEQYAGPLVVCASCIVQLADCIGWGEREQIQLLRSFLQNVGAEFERRLLTGIGVGDA